MTTIDVTGGDGFETDRFDPAGWIAGPHAQTVGARLLRTRADVTFQRERIDTPDDDFLDLDFAVVGNVGCETSDKLVLVMHGLEGSARSKYAIETYRQLAKFGVPAVGLNFRSCGGEINRANRLYHSGETEDPRLVLRWLSQRFPRRRLGVIAFSLGGNAMLKYLGENSGVPENLVAAVAVSVPFELSAGADYMEQSFARAYRWKLIRSLRAKVEAKASRIQHLIDLERARRAVTFREFDDAATAPLHGFGGAEDYYTRSSSRQFLPGISIPTYLIHSRDDPFLPPTSVPDAEVDENPFLRASFTDSGGHVGFWQGPAWNPDFWAERMATRFVVSRLRG